MRMCEPIEIQIAEMYLGASFCLTMKLPATPPALLKMITIAAVKTLFHCLAQESAFLRPLLKERKKRNLTQ